MIKIKKNFLDFKANLLGFLILISLITMDWVMRLFSLKEWGWDLNHMLFSGQRLLSGDLHWTSTFDDKLPLIQFLFAVPAAFESIAVWVLMSIGSILMGAWGCFIIVKDSLQKDQTLTVNERYQYSLLAAFAMLYLSTFMPAGIHHINPMAASTSICSMALLLISFRKNQTKSTSYNCFFLSALLASIAIGIRPYFLLMMLVAPIWAINRNKEKWSLKKTIIIWTIWITITAVFGLVVNLLPYLITGQLTAFQSGMQLLSQDLQASSIVEVIGKFFYTFGILGIVEKVVILGAIASCVYAVIALYRKNLNLLHQQISLDILILVFIMPVLLAIMIVMKHFWTHYIQMFAPLFSIGFGFFCYVIFRETSINRYLVGSVIIAISILASLPILSENGKQFLDNKAYKLEKKSIEISKFLDSQPINQRDFLYLDNMHAHWYLDEPRHKFPHAANTLHIINEGLWQSVKMPKLFSHPINTLEYCMALNSYGPSILIVGQQLLKFQIECLSQQSTYTFLKELDANTNIYIRI